MLSNFIDATYIAAGLMFILALAGLSKHETARKGNVYGIMGMVFAVVATNFAIAYRDYANHNLQWDAAIMLYAALAIGGAIGIWRARKVEMTGMPELIALLHSFVGAAAVLVGYNVHLGNPNVDALHSIEVYLLY